MRYPATPGGWCPSSIQKWRPRWVNRITPMRNRGSNPEDAVPGTVFEITAHELAAADQYEEGAAYRRIPVTLRSGAQAWVYVLG